ncbi:GNAT family N-acetyltransferase [Streptomyces acidiscabies]|uniref:GNAT family N-acetyltransferase n=1 Tax=Streptomyces acidiscabies TaxID=42234 RepID=UPI00073F396C|nr:GNAT family N-acetyltransferase [Streptomyces acidiscabies]GAQ56184.1 mycothiol acetyltransferase [Streptomyces acidiscabies]GAV44695.1 mycothiol acetyltransferase [Streptomyces acidiscabies]
MTITVRDLRLDVPADPEAFCRVRDAALPYLLFTPASVAHDITHSHPDAHVRRLVAEVDGVLAGTAQISLAHDAPEPGKGNLNVYVDPAYEGRGAGTALRETAEEYLSGLGATHLYAWVLDAPRNLAYAERAGYRPSRSAHFLRLDLTTADLTTPRVPEGVELRTAADYAADPRPLFELDAEVTSDEPGDVGTEFTDYEAWVEENWRHPHLNRALTSVVVVDGRPVALSVAHTDGAGRYHTAMTGTARAHRGQGLAKLAKAASLHRAREAGCTVAFTGNDTDNAPMLAINKGFGYEICATEVRHVRDLV